jgi:ribonucleoside-diphosphate reductase alpha chain
MNKYPIPEIDESTKKTRKIGLGIMGFADALYKLNIKYDSEEGIKIAEKIMKFIKNESYSMSEELAKTRGTYPTWKGSEHEKAGRKMRNACCNTIAPTGTLSMLADVSGGCEPVFAISFIKNVMDGTEMIYTNKVFENVAKEKRFFTPDLMRKIAQIGKVKDVKEVPKEIRDVFVTAQEIAPMWHVKMQATFQKYIDASISKTVNFPNSATIQDVESVYALAWESGCKGITIYRDGSRDNQVLNIGEVKGKISESTTAVEGSVEKIKDSKKKSKDKSCRIEVKDGRIVKSCE